MSEPKPVYRVTAQRPRITADEGARMVVLYDDGYSLSDIARAVGRTKQGVAQYLIRQGIHIPVNLYAPLGSREKAVDWYQRGVGVAHICRHFGLARRTLYVALRQRGIPLRYPSMSRSAP